MKADVAILGSGFSGSLLALVLRRLGRSVVLIERGRHPRFAIGESSTPLANLLLEELADRYGLPRLRPLSKWGTWRAAYPEIGVGLKRGFSFFRHENGRAFPEDREHERQLLVAASPRDAIGDTHWYRPDFDQFLAGEAVAAGALHLDATELTGIEWTPSGATLSAAGVEVRAGFVVDATGPRGFLHRTLGLGERPLRWLPPTRGVYAHFQGVERWDALVPSDAVPPYPVDDAALHHVFDGGWIWVLRFGNGITSAGAALTGAGRPDWAELLRSLPAVQAQFAKARAVTPFVHAPRLAFRSATVHGERFALLPSAAGVIDPLLSTGFPLTLLGIQRLAAAFETQAVPGPEALQSYADETQLELDATERLVAALYATMRDFPLFKRLSLLYFAAASFSETARRLGRPALAPGFLLCRHPSFGPESAAIAEAALRGERGTALENRIDRAIEPFDVAGLLDRSRRDWYPVRADDLLRAAARLEATPAELQGLLERCGFNSVAAPV
jgi:FADH2 O2-dependent halogenase